MREERGIFITKNHNRTGRYLFLCVHAKHYTCVIYLLHIEYTIKGYEIVLKSERSN